MVLAGFTAGSWGQTNLGESDFVAAMFNTTTAATPAPSASNGVVSLAPTLAPPVEGGSTSYTTPIVLGVVSAVSVVVLVALGLWTMRRRSAKETKNANSRPPPPVSGDLERDPGRERSSNVGSHERYCAESVEGCSGRPSRGKLAECPLCANISIETEISDGGGTRNNCWHVMEPSRRLK